jgi:probable O-glycosylation ligase (exosortase A-associated)
MKGLILTYLLAVGGTILSLGQPLIGLLVYIIFSIVRPQVLFAWAGDMNDMSLIVGIALLVGWAFKGLGRWTFGRAGLPTWCLLAFFGWFTLSALFAADPVFAFGSVIERAKVVLPFLVGITLIRSERWISALAWTIVLAHGYLGAEMNWSYFNGYNRAQAEGLLGDNNSFAVSMVAAVGPAIFLALSTKRWWKKGLAFGCALLCIHTVLLTFSRGGILSLAITGVVMAVLMPKRPTYLLALVLTGAIAFRLMGPEVTARFMTTFASDEQRDESAESRIELWGDCLTVMERHPVFGVGPWHWPRIAPEFGWPEGKQAHSFWMQLGAECGIPTLLFLVLFYAVTAGRSWSMARRSRGTEYEAYGLYVVSGLTGFIVSAQFVSMEGLEVPYYIALVGVAALKLKGEQEATTSAPEESAHAEPAPFGSRQPSWAPAIPSGKGRLES